MFDQASLNSNSLILGSRTIDKKDLQYIKELIMIFMSLFQSPKWKII